MSAICVVLYALALPLNAVFEIFWPVATDRGVTKGGKRGHNFPVAESLRAKSLRRVPKRPNNITSTFFNTVLLLPKDLRFEHEGAKLASYPGCHLTSLCPWPQTHSFLPVTRWFEAIFS